MPMGDELKKKIEIKKFCPSFKSTHSSPVNLSRQVTELIFPVLE